MDMVHTPGNHSAVGDVSQSERAPVNKIMAKKIEEARESLHKASPKSGIPSKRTTATNETKTLPTTPNASRSTMSSASRNNPKGSLHKSPTNPPFKADSGRSQPPASSVGPAIPGRRPRKTGLEDIGNKRPPSVQKSRTASPIKSIVRSPSNKSLRTTETAVGKRNPSVPAPSKAAARRSSEKVPSSIPSRPATQEPCSSTITSEGSGGQAELHENEISSSLIDDTQASDARVPVMCDVKCRGEHNQIVATSNHQEKVIEALQDRICKLSEMKELETERVKQVLAEVHASNVELRRQLDEQKQGHEDEVKMLSEKHAGSERELAATRTLLNNMRIENHQLSAGQESEHERLRALRAELEYRAFRAEEAFDNLTLERVASDSQIESLRNELGAAKSALSEGADQELAKLRADVQAAKQEKANMAGTLEKAKESHKMQVRELESALKVTTAELVELRTKRPNGSSYSGSPIPKSGLRPSRWVKNDGDDNCAGGDALVGEDLSSHIQGQMAGMREHLRQMDDMNEHIIKEQERFFEKVEKVATKSPMSITYRHVKASPNAHKQHIQYCTSDCTKSS